MSIEAMFLARSKVGNSFREKDFEIDELGIDSLSFMDVIMQIEQQENIVLRDDEVDKILQAQRISEISMIFETARIRQGGGLP